MFHPPTCAFLFARTVSLVFVSVHQLHSSNIGNPVTYSSLTGNAGVCVLNKAPITFCNMLGICKCRLVLFGGKTFGRLAKRTFNTVKSHPWQQTETVHVHQDRLKYSAQALNKTFFLRLAAYVDVES